MRHFDTPDQFVDRMGFRWTLLSTVVGLLFTLLAGQAHAQPYIIPTVVHVLSVDSNSDANISDAQVMDGLNVLNNGFNSITPPPIPSIFDSLAANMEVEFCLASIAPDGSPTTGIDRIETPWAAQGGEPGSYLNPWPTERYLNIWVVSGVPGMGGPPEPPRPDQVVDEPWRDGIMLLHSYMGTIGTGAVFRAPVIVHMAGHYLGLKDLWEDPIDGGPCGDDGIEDTPPCEVLATCFLDEMSCLPGVPAPVQNHMSWSYCPYMFTLGQKAHVHSILNSPVAGRDNLWSPTNLAQTGCGTTAINEQEASGPLNVFPNPFTDRMSIVGLPVGTRSVELFDLTGRLVHMWSLASIHGTIDLPVAEMPAGTYLIRTTGSGLPTTGLVQKE